MAFYELKCQKCGEQVEVWTTVGGRLPAKHKGCGGRLKRVYQPTPIVFRGSGFYITDSRKQAQDSKATESKPEKSKEDASGQAESGPRAESGGGKSKAADEKKAS